jgi:hypothetical protein
MQKHELAILGFVGVYIAAAVTAALGGGPDILAFINHPGTADWVQGIGGLLGVLAVVLGFDIQRRNEIDRENRLQQRQQAMLLNAASHVAARAAAIVAFTEKSLKDPEVIASLVAFGPEHEDYKYAMAGIDSLQISEFEDPEVGVKLGILRTLVQGSYRRLDIAVSLLKEGNALTPEIIKDLEGRTIRADLIRERLLDGKPLGLDEV